MPLSGTNYTLNAAGAIPFATNPALQENLIKNLWRPGASVGDGSTFDAVEYEATTGQLVGGVTHFQKLAELWENLTRIMKTQNLSSQDQAVADELDEQFLQATMTIEENPLTAAAANVLAGKLPDAGLPRPAAESVNATSSEDAVLDNVAANDASAAEEDGGFLQDLDSLVVDILDDAGEVGG